MSGGTRDAYTEEDVDTLSFGADIGDAYFLPNSSVTMLMERLAQARPPAETFTRFLEYARRFGGAVEITDVAAIDAVYNALRSLSFERPSGDGEMVYIQLHEYQLVALSNLNPPTIAATRALIPSMDRFTDEEISEMLAILRRASAQYTGLE